MHERDVVTQEPARGGVGDHAVPASSPPAVGVDAQAQLPGQRPLAGDPFQGGRGGQDGAERDRRSTGPAAFGEARDDAAGLGSRDLGAPLPLMAGDEHGAQPGVGVRLERGVRNAVVDRIGDQSTTVVMPASAAPSRPISVAA